MIASSLLEPAPGLPGRRRFLLQMAGLGGGALLGGCAGGAPLTVASHVWPGYEFMFLARREGWLEGSGVNLQETASATDSAEALRTGTAQAAALTLDEMLRLRAEGMALTAVLVFDVSVGADAVLARPEIGLRDLAGLRVGVEMSGVGWLMLNRLLEAAQTPLGAIRVLPLTVERHYDAMLRGEVDVLVSFEPTLKMLEARGFRRIFDSRQLPDMIFDLLVVRSDALSSSRQALGKLVEAHFRGLEMMRNNPYDTAFSMAERLSTTGQEVPGLFRNLMLPGIEGNRAYLEAKGGPLHRAAEILSGLMLDQRLVVRGDSLAELSTAAFLPYGKVS